MQQPGSHSRVRSTFAIGATLSLAEPARRPQSKALDRPSPPRAARAHAQALGCHTSRSRPVRAN
eukprot:5381046-Pyramimonas_sp.AAC.1